MKNASEIKHMRQSQSSEIFTGYLLIVVLSFCQLAQAQDWAQWRGPQRDGTVTNFTAPTSWPKELKLKWKVPAGSGYSSPLVSRDRIYLHTRNDEKGLEVVSCLDLKTGKTIWETSYPVVFTKNQYAVKMGKGPNSTPLLYDGKLYTLGVTAILTCFEAKSGKVLWRKDYSSQIDTSKLFCGTAMSPIVEQGSVIVHIGDDRKGAIAAFDVKSGSEKWRWDGDGPGYASPILAEIAGVRQVITLTDKSVVGLSTANGKLLWRMPFPDEWNENIVTPIQYGDLIILSGVRRGSLAIKVTNQNGQWETAEVWNNKSAAMYMSSPALIGDHLYGFSHLRKGQFFCLDANTGKILWATEGREGENAAMLKSGELIFALTADASLIVAKKNAARFEQLAKYQVAESATWSHPVILGKDLLVKDSAGLTLWTWF